MRDANDLLFDDRAGVQFGSDIVAGRPDDLYAAFESRMIRFRPDKRRQKRMVDIDDPVREGFDHPFRNDLHVTRQHDEVDLMFGQQLHFGAFLLLLVLLVDRENVERDIETSADVFQFGVIADNQRDLHVPLSGRVAGEHIVQAVRHFRNEDRHLRLRARKIEPEGHLVFLRIERIKIVLDLLFRNQKTVQIPAYTHEKHVFGMVYVLVEVNDIAFVYRDKVRNF